MSLPSGSAVARAIVVLFTLTCGCGGPADKGSAADPVQLESTPRGTPTGAAITQTIGAAGGILVSGDGAVTLIVPPGAVATDTQFGIQPITNNAGGGVGPAYRLTPDGAKFAQPLKLTFHTGADDIDSLAIAFQDRQGVWWADLRSAADDSGEAVSASINHFSDWAIVTYWVSPPSSKRLRPGESFKLEVLACSKEVEQVQLDPETLLAPLPLTRNVKCGPSVRTGRWLVNDIEGGSASVGTIVPGKVTSAATYTAPAHAPDPNPVLVTGELTWVEKGLTKKFRTKVLIATEWTGTITYTRTGKNTVEKSPDRYTTITTSAADDLKISITVTGQAVEIPYVPGMTLETVVILNAKNAAIGSQTYDWHEHYLGGECDGEGCDPLTEPHDYTYHEEIKGNVTRDNDEVLLHIKPDGSYSVEAFFNSPLMAGTYTANPGCSGGVSVPGNQIKVKIEGFGLPNPTSLVGKLPASTTDITVYSRHGSASDITLTEDVAVEWNFTLAK